MSEHGKSFDSAQRDYDNASEPDEYSEEEEHELFDSIPAKYANSEVMETWGISMMMVKLHKTGVYQIDLGEFSGSGSTKDEALKDLCEQIVGEE